MGKHGDDQNEGAGMQTRARIITWTCMNLPAHSVPRRLNAMHGTVRYGRARLRGGDDVAGRIRKATTFA